MYLHAVFIYAVSVTSFVSSQDTYIYTNLDSPCYVISAPETVRPGILYKVGIVLCMEEPMSVRAILQKDGHQVSSHNEEMDTNSVQFLTLKVPTSATSGNYSLTVEGTHPWRNLHFKNTTLLQFDPKFLSIVVQTNRAIYRAGQLVLFRVLILHTDMTAFGNGVDIFMMDPDGFIMRRWISAYTNDGVVSLKFKLPKMAKDGLWKIRIKAWDQIHEQSIKVETYFTPLFEVRVDMAPFIMESEQDITASVYGVFTSEKLARGNLTLQLYARDLNKLGDTKHLVWEQEAFAKSKPYYVNIPMSAVGKAVTGISGAEVTLEAAMTESLYVETSRGFSKSRIITSSVVLRFLTTAPAYFKPGMHFYSQVAVSYEDHESVPPDLLARSKIRIKASFEVGFGNVVGDQEVILNGQEENSIFQEAAGPKEKRQDSQFIFVDQVTRSTYTEDGVISFNFLAPPNAENIILTAFYEDEEGNQANARIKVSKYFSPKGKYLGVWTTTHKAAVEEFAIFHVKSNFRMSRFHYLVISKNNILSGGNMEVNDLMPTITTFSVALSADMAPGFRLLVFHITPEREIIADNIFLPLDALNRFPAKLTVNTGKDFKGDSVEVIVTGDEGAFIGIHAIRSVHYQIQAGNDITETSITDSLLSFEKYNRSLHYVWRQSRNGITPDETKYFSSMDYGPDLNRTFLFAGVKLLAHYKLQNRITDSCPEAEYPNPCITSGCYSEHQRCDGKQDCVDMSDETNCPPKRDSNIEYRIERFSRFMDLFDDEDGDWAWEEVQKSDHHGREFKRIDAPFVADDWYFTGFSVSPRYGLSIAKPVVYSTTRPFTAHLSGPEWCHRGEQVGLRLMLWNHDTIQTLVFITLIGSPDYKFVHVEEGGIVSSYGARLTSGDHQLLVYIAPESQEQIDFPIAPTVEQGSIEVKFVAASQAARSTLTHNLDVVPEGITIGKHTSIFLDLKNRAYVLNYIDIVVEESPIVPYQEWRNYVYGSPKASVSVTGDIIGPTFPEIPLTKLGILGLNGKGTDARMFEFAMNIWTLHYLRLSNQLQTSTLKEVLDESTTIFSHIMRRFNKGGWFTNWDSSPPSVWLTAWVLRVFKHAIYADWENILYIEPEIFERSIQWIVKYQSRNGKFYDTSVYLNPLDSKIRGNKTDIALTAHVLITLSECLEILEGNARSVAIEASLNAVRFLESNIYSVTDPYQLAISSYALTLAKSSERELALLRLQGLMRQGTDGLFFWSRVDIPTNPVKLENQRPFVQPRDYNEGDSEAVEATSYALLVLLDKDGVTIVTDKIVQWLSTMRMTDCGLISMTDTIIATQALTEYANQARLMDITKIDVSINLPSDSQFKHVFHIGNHTSPHYEVISEIPHVWGHMNVIAKGAGLAIVQMDLNYGIDYEPLKDFPTVDSFELQISEYYSPVRNKSAITIQSCFRWVRDWPSVSGAAVLEVDIPTGYHLVESEAAKLAESGVHPTLRDAQTVPGKTIWYFDHIPGQQTCFNHTIRRWFPVANMTLHRQALLYEIGAKERFVQVLVNSTPLYILNICEVCGSYQCPYCPYYNSVPSMKPHRVLYLLIILLIAYPNT